MARYVKEIMNGEVVGVRTQTRAVDAEAHILALGITAVPVVNDEGRAVGVVSLRDLAPAPLDALVGALMSVPAATIGPDVTIEDAGRELARRGVHRLFVTDGAGRIVGVVAALDIVRGLLGLAAPHPSAFPHVDRVTDTVWSDEAELTLDTLDGAPDGPGVFTLWHGPAGEPNRLVWTEAASNVRTRLCDLLAAPQPYPVSQLLSLSGLRFRSSQVPDIDKRRSLIEELRDGIAHR